MLSAPSLRQFMPCVFTRKAGTFKACRNSLHLTDFLGQWESLEALSLSSARVEMAWQDSRLSIQRGTFEGSVGAHLPLSAWCP